MPQIYTWPDGTKGTNRPTDGQVFYTFDTKGNTNGIWQWDDFKELWYNITSSNPSPQTYSYSFEYNWKEDKTNHSPTIKKCECGSETDRHSHYCPKYEKT